MRTLSSLGWCCCFLLACHDSLSWAFLSPLSTNRRCVKTRLASSSSHSDTTISLDDALALWANNNNNNSVRFVDATWYHKKPKDATITPRQAFEQGPRLPNSCYFDLDQVCCDRTDSCDSYNLSHMLPSRAVLQTWMEQNGLPSSNSNDNNNHYIIILYGQRECWFLPRVWFTFHALAPNIQVRMLQANLDDWIAAGGPVDTQTVQTDPAAVSVPKDDDDSTNHKNNDEAPQHVITGPNLHRLITDNNHNNNNLLLLDARGSSFARDGHMPGAVHLPYSGLSVYERLAPRDDLRRLLVGACTNDEDININPITTPKTVVCTCGSGVSACTLYWALRECGRTGPTAVYDGSWQEWRQHAAYPKILPQQE